MTPEQVNRAHALAHEQTKQEAALKVWDSRLELRRTYMRQIGYPEGTLVIALFDSHPDIPEFCGYKAGDRGEVILNMAHGAGMLSVVFPGSSIPHAIHPGHLRRCLKGESHA